MGNGTLTYAKYTQIGKTVHARFLVIFGSTTSLSGDLGVSLPVTAASSYNGTNTEPIGIAALTDTGSIVYDGTVSIKSSTVAAVRAKNASSTYLSSSTLLSATIPFTWTTNDRLEFSMTYEAA